MDALHDAMVARCDHRVSDRSDDSMKSEDEILHELQKVRAIVGELAYSGKQPPALLTGAEQALGWALDRLRAPSEAQDLISRQQHVRNRYNRREVKVAGG